MPRFFWPAAALMLLAMTCSMPNRQPAEELRLDQIDLPPGFEIDVYVDGLAEARSLALSDDGTLFIGTRRAGMVYAVRDADGDGTAEQVHVIAEDLTMPNGVAVRDGALYVAEVSRLLRYDAIETRLTDPPEPVIVYDDLPTEQHHGWKYIAFGPDGKLYVPVGAPCNICNEGAPFATILRMNPDGSDREVYARGVRNTVGFDWHPVTGDLWFTDNGRDHLGDDQPPCELNHAPRPGMHFGYPYVHGTAVLDPEFGDGVNPEAYTPPAIGFRAHTAPLGMAFYTGDQFPAAFRNQAFVAQHGSWNRSSKIGYRVVLVRFDDNHQPTGVTPFAEGWLQGETNWGRPVDLEQLPDGSLLLSDDQNGVVYRIRYTG